MRAGRSPVSPVIAEPPSIEDSLRRDQSRALRLWRGSALAAGLAGVRLVAARRARRVCAGLLLPEVARRSAPALAPGVAAHVAAPAAASSPSPLAAAVRAHRLVAALQSCRHSAHGSLNGNESAGSTAAALLCDALPRLPVDTRLLVSSGQPHLLIDYGCARYRMQAISWILLPWLLLHGGPFTSSRFCTHALAQRQCSRWRKRTAHVLGALPGGVGAVVHDAQVRVRPALRRLGRAVGGALAGVRAAAAAAVLQCAGRLHIEWATMSDSSGSGSGSGSMAWHLQCAGCLRPLGTRTALRTSELRGLDRVPCSSKGSIS